MSLLHFLFRGKQPNFLRPTQYLEHRYDDYLHKNYGTVGNLVDS